MQRPSCCRLIAAVIARCNVTECRRPDPVQRGLHEPYRPAELPVDHRNQARPQRRDCAGAADHHVLVRPRAPGSPSPDRHRRRHPERRVRQTWFPDAPALPPSFDKLGRAKIRLTPPPVAPSSFASSFQTVSLVICPLLLSSRVPPQASTGGRQAGKSTCSLLSDTPSVAPSSPEAAVTVTPTAGGIGASRQHGVACLLRPGVLGPAPADRDHRGFVHRVVHGGRNRIVKSLIGIRRKVHDNACAGSYRAGHFDIQHHLAVGILVHTRLVGAVIHGNRRDRGRLDAELREIRIQVGSLISAAQLNDPDGLARPGAARQESYTSARRLPAKGLPMPAAA